MNNLGKLAFIWATVVLLGGFSTLVKPRDFWYVSIIAFILSIGILGGYEDPAHQILVRAPDALTEYKRAVAGEHWRRRPRKLQQEHDTDEERRRAGSESRLQDHRDDKLGGTAECRDFLGTTILVALKLAQLAAVTACIYLSSERLRKHDFVVHPLQNVDPSQNVAPSQNVKGSMYIFYGLVLAQGILFIILLLVMDPLLNYHMTTVRRMYRLLGPSGQDILVRYTTDNYMEFIEGNVRSTLNTDLVAFAKKLVVSDSINDQLLGIWAIDYILRGSVGEYGRRMALTRLRDSLDSEALGKLVGMLGLIRAMEEEDIRGHHAARVVLKLAPGLVVENLPRLLYHVSLLLDINTPYNNKKKMSGGCMGMVDLDLVWFGLRILDKLLDNPDNCWQAAKGADVDLLLPQIIQLTSLCDHGSSSMMSSRTYDSWIEEDIIPLLQQREDIPLPFKNKIDQETIVGMSFKVLSKLLAAPGAAGKDLRSKTSESVQFLIHTGMIMGHVEATRVIACLALNDAARAEIGRSPEIINKLKDCLLSKTPHVNITKMAAKLYVLEETGSPQLSKIQSFIAERHRDQNLLPPLSAFIEELDLEPQQLSSPWVRGFIQALDLEDVLSAPRVDHSEVAFEALLLLLTADAGHGCQENIAAAVLEQISPEELTMVAKMLYAEEDRENRRRMEASLRGRNLDLSQIVMKIASAEDGGRRRSMAAKLLQNLHAFSGTNCFNRHMDVIDQELPKVLRSIVDEVVKLEDPASTCGNLANMHSEVGIKEGKLLSSFIGLTLQICTSHPNTIGFTRALESASLTVGTFVQKLNKILQVYRSPTTEFPGIRRSTLQLMTWMVENNSSYIEILLQCGVYEQLKQVARAARKLESFELFHCGVGVAKHSASIPALARGLQAQLELSPNFRERSHGIGEQEGTITVVLA